MLAMSHLLVVEDDADSRDALCELLARMGHHVDCEANGLQALYKVCTDTPDLVVLDLSLPQMDGAKFLEIIRSYLRLQSVPVIVWTGMMGNPIVEKAKSFHVDAVVPKGQANYSELLEAIKRSLGPIKN